MLIFHLIVWIFSSFNSERVQIWYEKGEGKVGGKEFYTAACISYTWSEAVCCAVLGAVNSHWFIVEEGTGGSRFFSPLDSFLDGTGLFSDSVELIDV